MANVIAIDGPSGAGKSSVSRIVGEKLGMNVIIEGFKDRIAYGGPVLYLCNTCR